MLECLYEGAYASYLSDGSCGLLPGSARGESAPAAGLTHSQPLRPIKFCCGRCTSVKLPRLYLAEQPFVRSIWRAGVSVGRDRQLRRLQGARPLVERRCDHAADVGLDQVPALRLGEEGNRRLADKQRLGLQVLLVAPRRLRVGAGHAHEVVVLLVLPERDAAGAGEEGGVPVR